MLLQGLNIHRQNRPGIVASIIRAKLQTGSVNDADTAPVGRGALVDPVKDG